MQLDQNSLANTGMSEDRDIFTYILGLWKPIAVFSISGVMAAIAYLTVPPKYEAGVLFAIAKVPVASSEVTDAPPIESTSMIIERLRIPSTYTPEAIGECGFDREPAPADATADAIEATLPRGLKNVMHITVRRRDPETAKRCVTAVFSFISHQQYEMVKERKDELNILLTQLRARVEEGEKLYASIKDDNPAMLTYMIQRDQALLANRRRIDEVQLALSRDVQARLVSPPYVSEVSRRYGRTLAIGAGAGLMFGFLFGAAGRTLRDMRSKNRTPPPGP